MSLVAISIGVVAQETRTIKGQVLYASDNEPLIFDTILPATGDQGTVKYVD